MRDSYSDMKYAIRYGLIKWCSKRMAPEIKSKIGAKSILAVSLALAKLLRNWPAALPLSRGECTRTPCSMMNILNGGTCRQMELIFRSLWVMPVGADSWRPSNGRWSIPSFKESTQKQRLLNKRWMKVALHLALKTMKKLCRWLWQLLSLPVTVLLMILSLAIDAASQNTTTLQKVNMFSKKSTGDRYEF